MKKILISAGVVVAIALYAIFANRSNTTQPVAVIPTPTSTTPTETTTSTPATTTVIGGTPKPTTGAYKNGSYTGPVTDAYYGDVQVKATVTNGKISNVEFIKYPDGPGETTLVSQTSMPKLIKEAIVAQSAKVNIISGATQTSEAFQQSLAAALAMAK